MSHDHVLYGFRLYLFSLTTEIGVHPALAAALKRLGVPQRHVCGGRAQTNGSVARLQQTNLDKCWRPSFTRLLSPKLTALTRDLKQHLAYDDSDGAPHLAATRGAASAGESAYGARKVRPR